jgi:glycosyltransferase involved in cell wall biosynthesis
MYRHSGIGRYLRNIFPLLLPLIETDHIRVLATRAILDEPAWLNDPRVELVETSAAIYSVQEQLLTLGGAYRATDLLWVPHYNAPLWYTSKMVATIHDIAPLAMPEILGNAVKRAYAKLLIERTVKQSSAILCVSQFTQNELATRLAVPTQKMTVTHAGLDAGWPTSVPPHVEPDATPYLLYVGNVKPNKNLGTLLRAFALVLDRMPHRLLLAGKMKGFGTSDAAVIRQADSLGDRVRFVGEIDDAHLQSLYAGAAALVLPSFYEGFGLPILEAMQLGCPVLASNAGSLPEVGGDAALYFDPRSEAEMAECLLQAGNTATMDTLRERGRSRVPIFSFQRCAEQSAAVMNRVIGAS